MPVELRVDVNNAGRRTLLLRRAGEHDWSEVAEAGLMSNPDPSDFYRRTAGYIGNIASKGVKVHYSDAVR
ncbi:hypothetical protein SAMN05216421_1244 [Halopseudomonas xinjiangensis]|uniref:Uncharacterized protein n=1 Tax=Halopseudomonas xinjiangensis TaxID=487184 RepID=A0A1H1QYU2_9GAMM|nr:hypothetical protein SAMN05216421_1244 [Halopseudomonas xinjiangensis]